MSQKLDKDAFSPIQSAHATISNEIEGLNAFKEALAGPLRAPFEEAIATIRNAQGRLIVTGMGKSGHIGRKLAATLASTGTPVLLCSSGRGKPW